MAEENVIDPRRRQLLQGVGVALASAAAPLPKINLPATEGKADVSSAPSNFIVSWADVNQDGVAEMLVAHLSGPHHTTLKVFGQINHWEFGLLGEIRSSTPSDFDIYDADGDGQLEVETIEVASNTSLPYAAGLRDRVTHKLAPDGFLATARTPCYSQTDLVQTVAEWGAEQKGIG